MEFQSVLQEIRGRMKLSQASMAEKLGISRASLSLYECGKQTPDLHFLDKLHKLTGAPIDYLMGYTDNYEPAAAANKMTVGYVARMLIEATENIKNINTGSKLEDIRNDVDTNFLDTLNICFDNEVLVAFYKKKIVFQQMARDNESAREMYNAWLEGELKKLDSVELN